MRIQIKHRPKASKPRPSPRDPLERLREWAHVVVRKEGAHLRPQLGIPRGDRIETVVLERHLKRLGPANAAEVAAVLMRTLGDDELLALLVPAGLGQPDEREANDPGLARGFGAFLVVRSRAGVTFGEMWICQVVRRHQTAYGRVPADEAHMARMPDFARPDFRVDPALDDHLARAGFPGAKRRDPSAEPRAPEAELAPAPEPESQRTPAYVPSPPCPRRAPGPRDRAVPHRPRRAARGP
jgi:hypothetical protein